MKRVILISVLAVLLLVSGILLVGCGGNGDADGTTESTTSINQTHEKPNTTIPDLKWQKDLDTLTEVIAGGKSETVTEIGYTGETNDEGWSINSGVDFSVYDYIGGGKGLIEAAEKKYPKKTISYYSYNVETNKRAKLTGAKVEKMGNALAFFYYDKEKGIPSVYIQELDLRVRSEFKSISGQSGYFMTVAFNTNLPSTFSANISAQKGATDGNVKHSGINATGKNGSYTASAKLTIPFVQAGQYYLNLCVDGGSCVASVPITISESEFTSRRYHLLYTGDWDLITDPNYQSTLTDLFYSTYARLYARWGTGTEPTTITFTADPNYDGVAYAMGTQVVVSVDYANGNPYNFGFFSHEITHSVQQYNFTYDDSAWWTENMANYGGFRYYHWSNAYSIQLWQNADKNTLYSWSNSTKDGYQPYGDGSKWFFAYLDDHWPTTKNSDGSLKYGLIDTINFEIKNGRLRGGDDNPFDETNMFNKIVKEVTGFNRMEDIRQKYADEFKSGEWTFNGFADYVDNFLTENLKDAPNPEYPKLTDPVHGDKTAAALSTPVTGEGNLCLDATILENSGGVNVNEFANKLIDGKDNTKWCATSASNSKYCLDGASYWAVIDLGEIKEFDTYTLYNCKTKENYGNMKEWEILVSNDAKNWTSVDYQKKDAGNKVSFNIGEQNARYVLIKIYNGDGNFGTLRLYEFLLYNVED